MTTPREQAKAITGGVLAGLWAAAAALADASVSPLEWVLIAAAAVGTYGAVFGVKQPVPLSRLPHLTSDELMELAEQAAEREKQ